MEEYWDDYGDYVIAALDPDHRNAVRVGRRIPHRRPQLPPARERPQRIVVRPRPRPRPEPIVVQAPDAVQPQDVGLTVGGMQISLTVIAGALLTLGGLGVQLASHFVSQPDPPDRSNAKVEDLVGYEAEKAEADRKVRTMESIGRALSDLGQLTALRRG